MIIADSNKGIFEDKLIALYSHNASKRYWCENWASWPRHTFVEHLKHIYPLSFLNVIIFRIFFVFFLYFTFQNI